jgi:hypothetical protein
LRPVVGLRAIGLLGLLLAWLSATAHCALERVLEPVDEGCCCTVDDGLPGPAHCPRPVCSHLESGTSLPPGSRDIDLQFPLLLVCADTERPEAGVNRTRVIYLATVRLWVSVWQFLHRATGEPRAPSLTS